MSALNRTVRRKCPCGEMVYYRYDADGRARPYDGQLGALRPHRCEQADESRKVGQRVLESKTPPVRTK